jgi:subtilase family protein/cadherin domain-containing protein
MTSSIRCATRYLLHSLIVPCMMFAAAAASAGNSRLEVRPAAVLPPQANDRAALALLAARARFAPLTLYAPTAWPEALPVGQATDVKFTVFVAGGAQPQVSLTVRQLGQTVPMLDDGQGPDLSAGDRIYSALFHFSAADASAGACYDVFASSATSTRTVTSAVRRVCATQIPVGLAASDFSAFNTIVYSQGGETASALADEVLIRVSPNLGDDRIIALAASVNGTVVGSMPAENLYQIRLPGPQTPDQLRQIVLKLQGSGGVLFAGPNVFVQLQTPAVLPLTTSDPLLGTQTNLDRINATKAWRITTGSASTVIAIIDTGSDFDHPDLWSGSTPRFTTDGGGNLVAADCTSGTCAAVTTAAATCYAATNCNTGMSAALDTYGHGTLLSGFAGAATDNATGVAAANWQARLLTVRFATSNSTATVGNLLAGINYAGTQGARILSISTANPTTFAGNILCPAVGSADSAGRLVVAAAGNDSGTGNNYPAACTNPYPGGAPAAMPVANSTVDGSNNDVIYTGTLGSNYGTWISIAAPGTSVISTARTPTACPTCDATLTSATGYATVTGTSFSTPLAAGAAGLVLAKAPSMTNADLRALLYSTGVALTGTGSYIHRIDVLAALLTLDLAPTGINLSPGACIPDGTNTAAGVSAGALTTVDPDAGLTGFEYTIVGGTDAAKFSIGGGSADQLMLSDGVLSYAAKPSYAVTVRTTDVGGLTFDQGFVVAVCAPVVNLPPVVTGGTFAIPEFSANGTVVGSVVATDPEGQPLAYFITAGNATGAFSISSTGQITVANQVELDFALTPVFNLTVTVSDGVNNVPAAVTVNLTQLAGPFPNPILVFDHKNTGSTSDGTFDYYNFTVQNWYAYSGELFVSTSLYGPCGLNPTPSRTWVEFFNAADNSYIYGFCALGTPYDMNGIWFAMPTGVAPPANVYIKLIDRSTTPYTEYPSNTVAPPFP